MDYIDIVYDVVGNWYHSLAEATPRIAVGIIVFMIFIFLSSFLSKFSVKIFHKFFPKSKDNSVVVLIKIFKFLIVVIGLFIALEIMGLGGFLFKFIGSLGVAGVVAGVALKDLVSSMFSGALVGVDKAFEAGDYVTIQNISGTVEKIGFLTTKIITDEGKKVFVPNQLIFSAPFVNLTTSGQRKVFLDLELSGTQNLEKATEVIMAEIKKFDFADQTDAAQVIVLKQSFGIFYIEVRFFMKNGESFILVRSEAIKRLKNKLEESGIELATQTQLNLAETGN
ncbi:mechanosensitive ion channel family protein [Frigoriflavimonas asaccharolytica]|uniref:Small conductance mechanosensitive channel n=1 Tax=Frigoriflavimonas asaccharolytica TaxID=2735899 RepID=A0A8J8G988_9FLAO|nr:mechanosensitive ion channel domain-containing protein [Frigoriflavimonas asaccharolytica]NRS91312.1 small conductance mechanosensitive channel [Frigoriflavimonas asaccharolytica]